MLFRTLDAFRVFDVVYVMTGGGPGTATEPIALYTFTTLLQNLRFGYGSALSVIVFVVAFVFALAGIRAVRRRRAPGSSGMRPRPRGRLVAATARGGRSLLPAVLGGGVVVHAREPAVRRAVAACRARWCSITIARCSATATSGRRSATR